MAILAGTEKVQLFTVSGSVATPISPMPSVDDIAQRATIAIPYGNSGITGGSGVTITAAQLMSGIIIRSGPTTAFTDTTDSAGNIIAAMGSNAPQSLSRIIFIRNNTNVAMTLAAGAGVTLQQDVIIPGHGSALLQIQYSTVTTVNIWGLVFTFDANIQSIAAVAATFATQIGSAAGSFLGEGLLYRDVESAGVNPNGTGSDYVVSSYTLPANAFDGLATTNRGIEIIANGALANNSNNKRIKLIANPSSATVGSVVGGSGVTIADTGTITAGNQGYQVSAALFKYGGNGSNTQLGVSGGCTPVAAAGLLVPALVTATESGAILIALTANATTAASDITHYLMRIRGSN